MPVTQDDLRLVRYEAGRYGSRGHTGYDDLLSDGSLGLMKAVELWDEKRDLRDRFKSRELFIRKVIKRTIVDGLRVRNGREREGVYAKQAFREGMCRLDVLIEEGDESMGARYFGQEDEHIFVVADLLKSLPDRERDIVWRSIVEGATLHEIAEELGVTESRVSQIRSQAFARLRGEPVALPREESAAALAEISVLSPREVEVLTAVAEGLNNKTIADCIHIAEETVKSHVRHLLSKLNAENRAHAVAIGFRTGLLT